MEEKSHWQGIRRIWAVALGYWLVASAVACWLYPCCSPDTTSRYAPMADAFVRGEWLYAFHPRFGVFFQTLSGSLAWLTGLPGDMACQVSSLLCLSLSAVPIWLLARRLFGAEVAWWSVAALLVGEDFVRYGLDGLRDTGKCLAFALAAYGAAEERPNAFALGIFITVTLVSYGFAIGCVLLAFWGVRMLPKRRYSALLAPAAAWAAGTAAVSFMVHAYTGWWLPAPQFIGVAEGML